MLYIVPLNEGNIHKWTIKVVKFILYSCFWSTTFVFLHELKIFKVVLNYIKFNKYYMNIPIVIYHNVLNSKYYEQPTFFITCMFYIDCPHSSILSKLHD